VPGQITKQTAHLAWRGDPGSKRRPIPSFSREILRLQPGHGAPQIPQTLVDRLYSEVIHEHIGCRVVRQCDHQMADVMKSQDRACSEVFQDDCAPAFQPLLQLKRLAPAQVTFFDRQSSVKQQRKFIGAGCRYGFIYPVTGHLSNLQIVEAERQSSSDSLLNLSHSFLKSEAHLVQPFNFEC